MPTIASQRSITPRMIELVTPYLEGATSLETAERMRVAHDTIRGALVNIRRQLRIEGYTQVHTSIGLRAALRHRGDIDHLNTI